MSIPSIPGFPPFPSVSVLIGIAVGLLVLETVLVLLVFRSVQRPPRDTPRAYLDEKRPHDGRVLVCLGASITHGRLGASYVDVLAARLAPRGVRVLNAGRNFDLAPNLVARLDDVVACRPDLVVVQVGSNDVNASLDAGKAALYMKLKNLASMPTLEGYRASLGEVLGRLRRETAAELAVLTIPVFSEDPGSPADVRTEEYNAVIREVAASAGARVLPLHERHAELLPAGRRTRAPGSPEKLGVRAVLERTLFRRSWNAASKRNGFVLMTDGVHLNEQGAEVVSELIERWVLDRTDRAVPSQSA